MARVALPLVGIVGAPSVKRLTARVFLVNERQGGLWRRETARCDSWRHTRRQRRVPWTSNWRTLMTESPRPVSKAGPSRRLRRLSTLTTHRPSYRHLLTNRHPPRDGRLHRRWSRRAGWV